MGPLSELPWVFLVSLSATTVDYTLFTGVLKSVGSSVARIRVVMVQQVPSESTFFGSRIAKTVQEVVRIWRILYPVIVQGQAQSHWDQARKDTRKYSHDPPAARQRITEDYRRRLEYHERSVVDDLSPRQVRSNQ